MKADEVHGDIEWGIVRQFARPSRRFPTRPMTCLPSFAECRGFTPRREPREVDHEIIFDSFEKASACAARLRELTDDDIWPYHCKRSRHGHFHLMRAYRRPKRCVAGT